MADSAIGREIGPPFLVMSSTAGFDPFSIMDGGQVMWLFFVFPKD